MVNIRQLIQILFLSGASYVLGESALKETRATVEKWVEARQLVAGLKADWKVEEEVLNQAMGAYERELSSLDAQIEKIDTGKSKVSEEFESTTQEKDSLTQYTGRLRSEITRLEAKLIQLSQWLPVAVKDRVSSFLDRIPEKPAETKLSVSTRMQNLLGVINEVDKFNGSVSVFSELRKKESGTEVQTQVLYIGLAQAYYVDPTGEFAGVGTPGERGWTWSIQPELGSKIQQAIEVYQGSQPASFVELPFQLK